MLERENLESQSQVPIRKWRCFWKERIQLTPLRQVHAKELPCQGRERDLTKGYEELDRLAQLFSYSAGESSPI